MKLKELLQAEDQNQKYTFIVYKIRKDECSPVFTTTPIRPVWEWLSGTFADEYIIIKKDHAPIDVSGGWSNWYNDGNLKCCMIAKPESLIQQYGEKQGNDMIDFYNRTVK